MNFKKTYHSSGFTIVEVLVVIITIAILATITVVVYSGMQKRAITTTYAVAADQTEKIVQLAALRGHLRELRTQGPLTACIGDADMFPAISGLEAGACYSLKIDPDAIDDPDGPLGDSSASVVFANPELMNALRRYDPNFKAPELKPVKNKIWLLFPLEVQGRGIVLDIEDNLASLTWAVPDKTSCGKGAGAVSSFIEQVLPDPELRQDMADQYRRMLELIAQYQAGEISKEDIINELNSDGSMSSEELEQLTDQVEEFLTLPGQAVARVIASTLSGDHSELCVASFEV